MTDNSRKTVDFLGLPEIIENWSDDPRWVSLSFSAQVRHLLTLALDHHEYGKVEQPTTTLSTESIEAIASAIRMTVKDPIKEDIEMLSSQIDTRFDKLTKFCRSGFEKLVQAITEV